MFGESCAGEGLSMIAASAKGAVVYRYKHSLYLNITNECTNDCVFCVRKFTRGLGGCVLWLQSEASADEILRELSKELDDVTYEEIVFCGYGEPLIRLDTILKVTGAIKKRYPDLKVRVNTNGQAKLLYPNRNVAKELKDAGVDSISISMNAENPKKYFEMCRPKFGRATYEKIIEFIKECKEHIPEVRVSVVEGYANIVECERVANELGVGFKVR